MNDQTGWSGEEDWSGAPEWDHESSQPISGSRPAVAAAGDGSPKRLETTNRSAARGSNVQRRSAEPRNRRSTDRVGPQPKYDDFPPRRRIRGFAVFLLTIAIIAAGALGAIRWFQNQIDPPGPPKGPVEVLIPNNTSTARIGTILHRSGVIGNPTVFRYWIQIKGKGGFDAGKYTFEKNSSFEAALVTLQDGPRVPDEQKLTIPEGFRATQVAARIAEKLPGRTAEKFMAAVNGGQIRSAYLPTGLNDLEGFLFPETYTFRLDDDEGTIASRMVETFDGVGDSVGLANASEKVSITPYQALIVASLVEREAKYDDERPKVARVIYNRLKADMYLQIDAGIVYALNNGTTRLFENDYKLDSPYNTYVRKGLPPGPIANPGKASIEAALNPEPGDWLYYVVTETDGRSSFAVSYKEHLKNIKIAKANGVR